MYMEVDGDGECRSAFVAGEALQISLMFAQLVLLQLLLRAKDHKLRLHARRVPAWKVVFGKVLCAHTLLS